MIGGEQPRFPAVIHVQIIGGASRFARTGSVVLIWNSVWQQALPAWRARRGRRKALDVNDQLQQAFFADLPLEHRHDVALVSFDDLRVGIENRFADIGFIGDHGAAVVEHAPVSEHIQQRRAAALAIGDVAGHAAILLK